MTLNPWILLRVLFIVAVVSIVAIICFFRLGWNWGDFFVNLLTEILGIAITVGIVEWIVRTHRARQWKEAERGVLLRLQAFVIASVIRVRVSLGHPGFPDMGILSATNYSTEYTEFRKLLGELISTAEQKITSLDIKHWPAFIKSLQDIQRESEMLVTLFGDKLEATQYKFLLNVNLCASKTVLWCPVLVNSIEQSPDWWPVTTMLRNGITAEFMNLINSVTELGDTLVRKAP